jgi:phage tail-like protein
MPAQRKSVPLQSDIMTTFHFYVEGTPAAVFTEVSGLEVEIEVMKVEEGGRNDIIHSLPGRRKVSDITLKSGITVSNELWKWFNQVLQGNFKRQHVSIVIVNQLRQPVQAWQFIEALPIKWSGPQLKADQTGGSIQSLVLTHRGLFIEELATTMSEIQNFVK